MYSHFEKIKVWQHGMDLAENIYAITKKFPSDERFGLVSQLRRASLSIPSNIAEGNERSSNKDFAYFVRIAKGSVAEVHTQLLFASRIGLMSNSESENLCNECEEISKMLYVFHTKLLTPNS